VLDELIDRYGTGAVLTVSPYVLDSGDTLRWILQIDGKEVPYADVRIQEDPDRPDWMLMFLVRGDEEVEIERWSTKRDPHGPASVYVPSGSCSGAIGEAKRRSCAARLRLLGAGV
jgi:hypothetical protein